MDARQLFCCTRDVMTARLSFSIAQVSIAALSLTVLLAPNAGILNAGEKAPVVTADSATHEFHGVAEPDDRFGDERQRPFVLQKIRLVAAEDDSDLLLPESLNPQNEDDDGGSELRAELKKTESLLRKTVPAARMTVRRDPSSKRLLSAVEGGEGKTIREVQEDLKATEQKSQVPIEFSARFNDFAIMDDLPYGKYLYIHHDPLFFEDTPAERYGEVSYPCVQPVISFTKFMGTFALIPFKVTADYCAANHEGGVYAYDHHNNLRPGVFEGSYFPSVDVMRQYPKATFSGIAVTAATATGLIFVLP